MAVDILYVAAGTTAGLIRGDKSLLQAFLDCGASVRCISPNYALPAALRPLAHHSLLTVDIHESLALRNVTSRALRSEPARAIVYSTTHAAMLRPLAGRRAPMAIRFDTPAQLSRKGHLFAPEYWLERRRFGEARLLLPWGTEIVPEVANLLPSSTPAVPLPIPIEVPPLRHDRQPFAITYAASPLKKGLDLVVRAWTKASVGDRRLKVAGIDAATGRRFLRDRGLQEPRNLEWLGLISAEEFRALTLTAELYLAASRYENYGIAQLEALADGALLVTLPSPGPFAARNLAHALAPGLIAAGFSAPALTEALEAAIRLEAAERSTYRSRAHEALRAHSREELEERVRSRVLPELLGY